MEQEKIPSSMNTCRENAVIDQMKFHLCPQLCCFPYTFHLLIMDQCYFLPFPCVNDRIALIFSSRFGNSDSLKDWSNSDEQFV